MNSLLFLLLSVGMLYASAGAAYLCFRFFRPETEFRMWQFLNTHHAFFASRFVGFWRRQVVSRQAATPKIIRAAGKRGWIFLALPVSSVLAGPVGTLDLALSATLMFFGGQMFAWSWYGLRCLRRLGLDSPEAPVARSGVRTVAGIE